MRGDAMRRVILPVLLLALGIGIAGSEAKPPFQRGGSPGGGGGGVAQACDSGLTGDVCAQFQNGQTFVTWTDMDIEAAGNNWRYRHVRSTAGPITSGNYGSATVFADKVFNNSALLSGGHPDTTNSSTNQQTQANRQIGTNPRVKLTNLGTELAAFTGVQPYTALANENAYYAVVALSCPAGVCPTTPTETYIGSVGPIAESVQTVVPIKWAASGSRTNNANQITSPAGKATIINFHQSAASAAGGPATGSPQGDYWTFYIPAEDQYNWNDGAQTTNSVFQESSAPNYMRLGLRDSLWNPRAGDGPFPAIWETFWSGVGVGVTPNPFMVPNRRHLGTAKMVDRAVNWYIGHYGVDPNQLHWLGQSMGAMGAVSTGLRKTSPQISSMRIAFPVWQMYLRNSGSWPGNIPHSSWPFMATLGTAPSTMGTVPENVLLPDGTPWGGAGGYADSLAFLTASPGDDLPVIYFGANYYDSSISVPFSHQLDAVAALESSSRGFGFVWDVGNHEGGAMMAVFDCSVLQVDISCVPWNKHKLNEAYPAFKNSSIDDDPGTGTLDAFGIMDGDDQGCINCGFTWTIITDTSSNLHLTIDNNWMDRAPTPIRQATLTGSMASSGSGSVTVDDGSVFLPSANGPYFVISDAGVETEIVIVTSVSGNTVNFTTRGHFDTSPLAHSAGAVIRQYIVRPTGPNGGPYTDMTADLTMRRLQGFIKTNGTTVNCTVTPNGEAPVAKSGVVFGNNGVFTLTGIKINASGETDIDCTP
jgi:hypothetical protein